MIHPDSEPNVWQIVDYTNGKNSGYLQLTRNGERIAQFFPYAKDANAASVRLNADLIAATMNGAAAR